MAICSMPKPEEFEKLSPKDFLLLNEQGRSMSWRISIMAEMIMIPESEIYEKKKIVLEFIDLLKPYYPDCDVIVFGSSANGFGFKGCDLDLLFLPFPDYSNFKFKGNGNNAIPKPHLIRKSLSRNKLLDMDERMHLKFVQRIMYTSRFCFESVVFIPAKCPILNIKFLNSPLSCDFSASNRIVVYNTELLWLYGKLDDRVKPLVMVLRYWAKSLGFISKTALSSYCFTLMVIFFLQNTYPAILPPVKFLNELAGYSRFVDGWNTALYLDVRHIISFGYENRTSLGQLFREFFDFYWEFDFVKNVVSPYYGRAISMEELRKSNDERIRSFQVKPFSIQDPFILSGNLGRCPTKMTSFKLSLLIAKKLLFKKELSYQLFSLSSYQQEMSSIFSCTKANLSASSVFIPVQLTYDMYIKLRMTTKMNSWFEKIYQTILDILQQGLCIECEVVDIDKALLVKKTYEPPSKRKKVNNDGNWNLQLITSVQCCVNFPTIWKHIRAQIQEDVHNKLDNHSTETVTNEVTKQSKGKEDNCLDDKVGKNSNNKTSDHLHNKMNEQLSVNENNALKGEKSVKGDSSDTVNIFCENVDDQPDDEVEISPSLIKDYKISKQLIRSGLQPVSSTEVTNEEKGPYLTFLCNFYKYPDYQISDIIIGFSPLTNEKVFYEVRDFLQSFVKKHMKTML